ncbi:MAG: arginine--tRNA ligase [Deltaproteobacteria bacterium]|nr:arginine--tRNA ligase [Deltaproteobacteria bacterium]MBW2071988.1 arginine--tRNA ligase [Deltaproteobacteria bacterium]
MLRSRTLELLTDTLRRCSDNGLFTVPPDFSVQLEVPKNDAHGDFATNLALNLAAPNRLPPREIAAAFVKELADGGGLFSEVEVAGPGFINLVISPSAWYELLSHIHQQHYAYGRSTVGADRYVQVEFVSANPTGPLHVGHGRGAALGDALARLLEATGHRVEREYYVNDAGTQMETLGRSVFLRYLQLLGQRVEFPEACYQGDYILDLAREIIEDQGDVHGDRPEQEVLPFFSDYAARRILQGIRDDLQEFGIRFDRWFSEKNLYDSGAVDRVIEILQKEGHLYEKDGALWFRATVFGDEKDRVLVRANGMKTYFASDLAYHLDKYERGFDLVIDLWGADHHGYVPRMQAGVQALGRKPEDLKLLLVQLVNLLRRGKQVAMSTRAGEFVTLREVIDEVGRDAARFTFLTRRSDSPLDFDLELVKEKSADNPVFYVQYAHARISSVIRVARERQLSLAEPTGEQLQRLSLPEELGLIKQLGLYPQIVENSARFLEPHRIPYYLTQLASAFHSYYNKHRIVQEDTDLAQARLYLVEAIRIVVHNGLEILGVSAPEKM